MRKFTKFDYYRYWLAEKLHRFVNVILFTKETYIGYCEAFDKKDQESIKNAAEHLGRTYEVMLAEAKEQMRKRQLDTLLYTLKQDGYYEETEETNDNGDIIIGFCFSMLATRAKTIKNEIEQSKG